MIIPRHGFEWSIVFENVEVTGPIPSIEIVVRLKTSMRSYTS